MEKIDKYWICDWFIDSDNQKEYIIEKLYIYKESVWLDSFMWQMLTEKESKELENEKERVLDITLKYLYPLLKEWKLKVMIWLNFSNRKELWRIYWLIKTLWYRKKFQKVLNDKNIDNLWKSVEYFCWENMLLDDTINIKYEYSSKEVDTFIKDIKTIWESYKNEKDAYYFLMLNVGITLKNNEFYD